MGVGRRVQLSDNRGMVKLSSPGLLAPNPSGAMREFGLLVRQQATRRTLPTMM